VTTSVTAPDTALQIVSARLAPGTLVRETDQPVRGGFAPPVAVTSSDTAVGAITVSPLAFDSGVTSRSTAFHPVAIGTTALSVIQPEGFTNPAVGGAIEAVVKGDITLGSATVGRDLQVPVSVRLVQTPPEPMDVTVTSSSEAGVTLSDEAQTEGAQSVTLTGVADTTPRTIYVQGRSHGAFRLTAAAAGYKDKQSDVAVVPSGFMILSPASIEAAVGSGSRQVKVYSCRLAPATLLRETDQAVRGGLGVVVPIASSDPGVGTLSVAPLEFSGGQGCVTTLFQPVAAGACTVLITTPEGFTTPAAMQSIPATVN
jgi:hypothetical protein